MSDDLAKLYLAYRLYLFPIIVGISALILILFVIYPQTVSLMTNQNISEELFTKLKFLDTKVQALEGYNVDDLTNKVDVALGFYPVEKDIIPVLGLLQSLTAQTGFTINAMSLSGIGGKVQNTKAQSFSIKMELIGPNQSLPFFLSQIESSKRLMRVNSVDVISSGVSGGVGVSVEVDVLYSSPPTDLGSINSPLPELSKKDLEVIAKLTGLNNVTVTRQQSADQSFGLRGKANPFE